MCLSLNYLTELNRGITDIFQLQELKHREVKTTKDQLKDLISPSDNLLHCGHTGWRAKLLASSQYRFNLGLTGSAQNSGRKQIFL